MSQKNITLAAALEEFHEELQAGVSKNLDPVVEMTPEAVDEEQLFAADFEQFANAAQALEDIVALVEDTPEEADQPLPEPFRKAINIAMEDMDMSAEQGEKKGDFVAKAKERIAKILAALAAFAEKVMAWVRENWTKATDKTVRASKRAEGLIARLNNNGLVMNPEKEIQGQLATAAQVVGGTFAQAMGKVASHLQHCGSREINTVIQLTEDALNAAVSDSNIEEAQNKLAEALAAAINNTYEEEGGADVAQAVGAGEGAKVLITGPLLGGYVAWGVVPADAGAFDAWKHGLSKVAEVQEAQSIKSLSKADAIAVCKTVQAMAGQINSYRSTMGQMNKLAKELKSLGSRAGKSSEETSAFISKLQKVVPSVLKGPQVAALNYAGSASNIAMAYVEESIKANAIQAEPKAAA